MWVFTSFQKGNTKQNRKPPLLPVSPVHDDGNDDEHELFSYLPVPLSAEPVTFRMLTDLPTVQQPVPVINQPIVPAVSATEEESEITSEEPVPIEEEQVMDSEAQEICCEPANLAETPRADESPSSDPHTVEPSRNDLLQHSPTESKPLNHP